MRKLIEFVTFIAMSIVIQIVKAIAYETRVAPERSYVELSIGTPSSGYPRRDVHRIRNSC